MLADQVLEAIRAYNLISFDIGTRYRILERALPPDDWEAAIKELEAKADELQEQVKELRYRIFELNNAATALSSTIAVRPMVQRVRDKLTPEHRLFYNGNVANPDRCAATTYSGYQCQRRRGYGPHQAYCRQHAEGKEVGSGK